MSFRHYKLKSKLSFIVDFAVKVGNKTSIRLSNNSTRHGEKTKGQFVFSKMSLKTVAIHLTENCYSNVENVTMKQSIGISVGKNVKCIIKGRIVTLTRPINRPILSGLVHT